MQADAGAAAGLVLRAFPGDHAEVVAALSPTPRLQYLYLKAAMQVGAGSLLLYHMLHIISVQ